MTEPGAATTTRTYDAFDVRPVRRWLEARASALGYRLLSEGRETLEETFWDTEDWRLLRAGLQLRVRGSLVELGRLDEPSAEAATRFSGRIEGDPAGLTGRQGPVADRVRALTGPHPIRARFRIGSQRERLRLETLNGTPGARVLLETISIPVEGSGPPAQVSRVHVDGEDGPNFRRLWHDVEQACALRPGEASRVQTALLALGVETPPELSLGAERAAAGATVGELAYATLRRHYRRMRTHEPGTRLGDDIEELHVMRVSIRRLRSVMKLFEAFLPRRLLALRAEFGWVARALGEVRDLDVQLERIDGWREMLDAEDRPALDSVAELLTALRVAARRRMLRTLDTKRYARLLARAEAALGRHPRTPPAIREPIEVHAPALIERAYRRVVRPGRKIRRSTPPEAYHRLRIRCKALRYTLETHADIYGGPAKRMIRSLVRLQDLLGDHQDADVAVDQLRRLRDAHRLPADAVFVLGVLAGRYRAMADELRQGFPAAFVRIEGKRWKRMQRTLRQRAERTMAASGKMEPRWSDPKTPPRST